MSHFVNIEVIQPLPFSNANRDDAGQPKTVLFGGKDRGRLSSQSLKRAARFHGTAAVSGHKASDRSDSGFYRTRYIKSLVEAALRTRHGDEKADASKDAIEGLLAKGSALGGPDGKKNELATTLVVLTTDEINAIADLVAKQGAASNDEVKKILATSGKKDIALWGRFFASDNDSTIDGSAQVAHAITTHAVNVQPDFFVGMDDASDLFSDHAGGGHPGDSFFLQGTFYKYANFNIEETVLNLLNADLSTKGVVFDKDKIEGLEDVVDQITEKFVRSFALAVPQGKIRSTAHTTVPALIRVSLTKGQPVNAVTAFEEAVTANDITKESIKRLNTEVASFKAILGAPESAYVVVRGDAPVDELGDKLESLPALIDALKSDVREIVVKARQNITN